MGLPTRFTREIAKDATKAFIRIEHRAVAVEESKKFAGRSQQRRELLGT